jgi:hypothetical protein
MLRGLERVGCSQPDQEMTLAAGDEILSTLDQNAKQLRLRFYPKCTILWATVPCFERVEKISAQNPRCGRRMTNPLLLEGGICHRAVLSCDRACLHFWREVWLRRVLRLIRGQNALGRNITFCRKLAFLSHVKAQPAQLSV